MALTARASRIAERGELLVDFGPCLGEGHNRYHCRHEVYRFMNKFFYIVDPGWGNVRGDAEELTKGKLIELIATKGKVDDLEKLVQLGIATDEEIDRIIVSP